MPAGRPHLTIVGGGTAGWLAALIPADAARRAGKPLKVTVVESSKIPTIGVGEGTTAIFKSLIDYLGIDEAEFLRETGGTIKYGIRHKDWRKPGVTYDGPIDDPHALAPVEDAPDYLSWYTLAAGRRQADYHLFGRLMAQNKAPYALGGDGGRVPVGPFQYAYHIDAAAVGRYLRTKADDVEIVDGVVADADLSEAGRIEALVLDDGRRVAGDFFIDCTGFRRRLISGALGAGWVSYADALPVNRAMPFWLDHDEGEIEPVTLAWAMKAGWMWRIPTQQRLGCGYVYSDRHLDPEGAKVEIETALGREIEPRADLRFDIGRLDQAWVGNCLAVGLAQSFLEPLEATSIHGTVVQLMLFSQDFMAEPFTFSPAERDDFNRRVGRQVDDFRTFINLHYVTERDDSPFWREVRDSRIHAETKKRLEVWRDEAPRAGHFESFLSGLPHVETQLYYPVLDGLGLLDRRLAQQEMEARPALRRHAREVLAKMDREFGQAARQAMGHRDFLESL